MNGINKGAKFGFLIQGIAFIIMVILFCLKQKIPFIIMRLFIVGLFVVLTSTWISIIKKAKGRL